MRLIPLILFGLFVLLANTSNGEILFFDDFNDHSDWSPTQYSHGGGSNQSQDGGYLNSCTGCPDGEAKYLGYYVASSAWNDYVGKNTIEISSENDRHQNGKSATFWMEPIDSAYCDGGSYWCSDGQLSIKLPESYQEIYVRFFIKFDPGWVWDSTIGNSGEKFLHFTHWNGEPSLWKFFTSGNHWPIFFFEFVYPKFGGGGDRIANRFLPRYQATYYPREANPPLPFADGEDAYVEGGSGTGGHKKWAEYVGDGNWHQIDFHVKGNTSGGYYGGQPNGVYEMWTDGELIYRRDNLAWADGASANNTNAPSPFNGWNCVFIGGNAYNRYYQSHEHKEQWYAIDELTISSTPLFTTPSAPVSPRLIPVVE